MKKSVLLLVTAFTLINCKKSEIAEATKAISTIDSAATAINKEMKEPESKGITTDSIAAMMKNIPNEENIKKITDKVINQTNKSIDSIAKSAHKIPEIIDETLSKKSEEKVTKNDAKPQIIKETKIIYKEKPKKYLTNKSTNNPLTKYGNLGFNVENNIAAVEEIRSFIKKYDGIIKTENLNSNTEIQTNYISAKIPLKKYDYLIEDLLDNIGTINDQNLEISGDNYDGNKLCDIDITLYSKNTGVYNNVNKSFGEKTIDAISKGWDVIGSILLFLLPFWPLFLIGAIAFYFYKKNKKKQQPTTENKEEEKHKNQENL